MLQVTRQTDIVQKLEAELSELTKDASAQKAALKEQLRCAQEELAVAQAETEEAIRAGNSQYMVAVAQHLQREEEFKSQEADWQAQLGAAQEAASARSVSCFQRIKAKLHILLYSFSWYLLRDSILSPFLPLFIFLPPPFSFFNTFFFSLYDNPQRLPQKIHY
jgi:hypothetical protein